MVRAVVTVDGSQAALDALDAFLKIAEGLKDTPDIHCVFVVDYFRLPRAALEAPEVIWSEGETALAAAGERARALGYTTANHVVQGSVVDAILEYCRIIDATILVMGTHGRRGIKRAVLGSTCEAILHRSKIPVLAVRVPYSRTSYGGGIDGCDAAGRLSADTPAI